MLRRDYGNTALLWSQVHQVAARLKMWLSKDEVESMMAGIAQCIAEDSKSVTTAGNAATYWFHDGSALKNGNGALDPAKGSEIGYEILVNVIRTGDGSENRGLLEMLTMVQQRAMAIKCGATVAPDPAVQEGS